MRLSYSIYRLLWIGFDWLYPPKCGGCGRLGARWCLKCSSETKIISPPYCLVCGFEVYDRGSSCKHCLTTPPSYNALRSWAIFTGPVRNAIHRLKYRRDIAMGDALARPMIDIIAKEEWEVDLVVPVPLGVARTVERGYNQAALLARPIAMATGRDYEPSVLKRIRETRSQVGLSLAERYSNVSGAFVGNSSRLADKRVLLVDDVATSGATLGSCSLALRRAGARDIFCITLARAE